MLIVYCICLCRSGQQYRFDETNNIVSAYRLLLVCILLGRQVLFGENSLCLGLCVAFVGKPTDADVVVVDLVFGFCCG